MNTIINIAHRGARSIAPENTILAAKKALDNNADMWELDVQMTSDFELIVVHDNTLERTSNIKELKKYSKKRPWFVNNFTLDEILDLDFGSWYIEQDPFGLIKESVLKKDDLSIFKGLAAPTLYEAMLFTKKNNFRLNIEIKDLKNTPCDLIITKKVLELIDELELIKDVIVSSFNYKYLYESKKINSSIKTAMLSDDAGQDHLTLIKELKSEAFHPHFNIYNKGLFDKLKNIGILINVWNINKKEQMIDFIKKGVNGIFTDFPQLLKDIIS